MPMTPAARKALSTTLHSLRERLVRDLANAAEGHFRLGHPAEHAGLDESTATRRRRFEAHVAEQRRAEAAQRRARPLADHVADVVKQAAYTLLNRHVLLRVLEARTEGAAAPLRATPVLTGGWRSRGYLDFRALAPDLVDDATEGYAYLLSLVYEDLVHDLPGLFGPAGAAELLPVPPATLRHLVETLDAPELASCWSDDMTLGWVYQYWNDPERELLDAKINDGGKIEPHELASKTQLFTERYMVDWLLQNTLLPLWQGICARNGWTPEAVTNGTLARLDARRADWRARREAGDVALTELMPLHTDEERRWAYYVTDPGTEGDTPSRSSLDHDLRGRGRSLAEPGSASPSGERDLPTLAAQGPSRANRGGVPSVTPPPDRPGGEVLTSLRDLRMIDPAVGSGHFLVVALDLLFGLYREEARHRGLVDHPDWTDRAIVEHILAHNLHGVDIDPRAVQIAAAALWVKGQQLARGARPARLGLVAANLRLASLPSTDAALVELRDRLSDDVGIPAALTDELLQALRGADHLGTLLKVDAAVDAALARHEAALGTRTGGAQGDLFTGSFGETQRTKLTVDEARVTLLGRLEAFLAEHSGGEDLGLRLRGEQLAAGVRFVRMLREGTYDLVVANPPYQGTGKMAESAYVAKHYPLGKADLYAAFLLRGLQLARPGATSAMLTMRNWMFLKTYAGLREALLEGHGLVALGDFETGAFEEIGGAVVSVTTSVFRRGAHLRARSIAVRPGDAAETSGERTHRKRAATLCHAGLHTFNPQALRSVPEWPLVYGWDEDMLRAYRSAPLIGEVAPARQGLITGDMTRFLRVPSELAVTFDARGWVPYVMGAKGRAWLEPNVSLVQWRHVGLEVQAFERDGRQASRPQNQTSYFRRGVAFSMIGAEFSARVHRFPSIFGDKGSSVFPDDLAGAVCAMNSRRARDILASLNPSVSFQVGDVNRLPLFPIEGAQDIFATVEAAFGVHESHREPSVEFQRPGPSPWRHAQEWAQQAVDRPEGTPLPAYVAQPDAEPAFAHLSYALGVALGRFDAHGKGGLDPASDDLTHALPAGVLVLDGTLDAHADGDDLAHPACAGLHAAWTAHRAGLDTTRGTLRDWLRLDAFAEHRAMYENRPIHWPLSSARKTFVAWVNIHRMDGRTLDEVQARLQASVARLKGECADLDTARRGEGTRATAAERRYARVLEQLAELDSFLATLERCAWVGAPPAGTDAKPSPPREVDARYVPDLDDGVMINSAALWPLLEPQWKDPKKWWAELSTAAGRKDYDWSHLARRYWPARVDAKCKEDPSLGVAHGCFWRWHPARAWAWELRLQDEIGPDFRIREAPHTDAAGVTSPGDEALRTAWLAEHPAEAREAIAKEALRRARKGRLELATREDGRATATLRLLEPGLWQADPEACWALEVDLSLKLGAQFCLRAPDEEAARAELVARDPEIVARRGKMLEKVLQVGLIRLEGEDDGMVPGDEEVGDE